MNLHSVVRGAIQAVNADVSIWWMKSTGYANSPAGKQRPQYADPLTVRAQIQPPSGRDLRHLEFLNIQGTIRTVYLFSNPQAIVRVDAKGGDLLFFPQFSGQPMDTWLVVKPDETWDVDSGGWSKVFAVLQADRNWQFVLDSQGNIVTDSNGRPIWGNS